MLFCQYQDSGVYLEKMHDLQYRGLSLVKTQILHLLQAGANK